jgi:osmoprotectant transport system substrate-binding protein
MLRMLYKRQRLKERIMNIKKIAIFVLSACLVLTTVLTGCKPAAAKGPIVVGSKIDTEGGLLAQMIIQVLRANGFAVTDKSQFGTTSIVRQALLSGELDIYPEYTGNGAVFFPSAPTSVWSNAQQGYDTVKQLDQQQNNIVWLTPAPANNTWAIAVTAALASSAHLVSMDDFAAYVNGGGNVKLIGSDEFITSPVALPKFEQVYGFTLTSAQLVSVSSGDTAQTEKAAYLGTNGINAAMAYGTDGSISAFNLVVLTDPKGAQPVYEPAPTVRGAIMTKYPQIATLLDPVFASLTLTTLQSLNGKIVVDGQPASTVAHDYLVSKGFLKA